MSAAVEDLLERRTVANQRCLIRQAERVALLCHGMAERFARGGRLLAFGASPQERSDARHVAVEFVHPVIVGKRALPAIGFGGEGDASSPFRSGLIAEEQDIAIAFGAELDEGASAALAGRTRARLPDYRLRPGRSRVGVRSAKPRPVRAAGARRDALPPRLGLVHVFFDHRGLLEGRDARGRHDAGAASFLYPFLAEDENDLHAVLSDVQRSVLMKAGEITDLRRQTLSEGAGAIAGAAAALRSAFDGGGTLLVFGNGGSATDAMDAVADFRFPPHGWPARRALDLTEDSAILTALANDIGPEVLFQRQVIAHARAGDVALALSTSGSSANIVEALERRVDAASRR